MGLRLRCIKLDVELNFRRRGSVSIWHKVAICLLTSKKASDNDSQRLVLEVFGVIIVFSRLKNYSTMEALETCPTCNWHFPWPEPIGDGERHMQSPWSELIWDQSRQTAQQRFGRRWDQISLAPPSGNIPSNPYNYGYCASNCRI